MPFLSQAHYEELPDGIHGKLTEDLVYALGEEKENEPWAIRVTIPKGFVTNFASTPRFLWSIFPPRGRYSRAAILHDFLYRNMFDRFLADAMFRASMKELKVPWWRRVTMYYAVRLLGGLWCKFIEKGEEYENLT